MFLRFQSSFSLVPCWSVVSKGTGTTCALPVDSMFTSIGFVGMSLLIFRFIFSLGSISNPVKKSSAVFFFPGMCAMRKSKCTTKFHKGAGIHFVGRNLLTDLLYDLIITGLVAPQKICPNSSNAR